MTKHESHSFKVSTGNPLSSVWLIFELYDPQSSLVWASLYLHSQFNSSALFLVAHFIACRSALAQITFSLCSFACLSLT